MNHYSMTFKTQPKRQYQRGVSSFIVMILLVLALISVLAAQRVGLLNEAFVGNDSDYQRTFAAAEAMMQDAKLDIKLGTGRTDLSQPYFPSRDPNFNIADLRALIPSAQNCKNGICAPLAPLDSFWTNASTFATMKTQAAQYGQYTGESPTGNNILIPSNNQSWYWVEVFHYNVAMSLISPNIYTPATNSPYVFRITAIAQGNRPGSRVVLQSFYVPRLLSAG